MAEQAGGDDARRFNVDALATQLGSMLSNDLPLSPRRCIFRVPNILRRHNPKAYAPHAFSFGPFHYNKRHLKATQSIKLKYLNGLLSRFPGINSEVKLRNLTEAISQIGEEARECYAGGVAMSMDEFVKVLVLDGCFLIELFRKLVNEGIREQDDPIFSMCSMRTCLSYDLILLENQIPWMVLDRLFNMTMTPEDNIPLNILALLYFHGEFSKQEIFDHEEVVNLIIHDEHENKHILDLIRNSMVLLSSVEKYDENNWRKDWQRMPSATSLLEAGIKFKKATSSTTSILDIKFNDKDGILEIPQLVIQEAAETLFRNLICLEQCLPNCDGIITSYAVLLDNLIDTAQDMEILCKTDIFENWLDIKESTGIFNQFFNDAENKDFYYIKLTNDVNKYCQHRWPRYRTVLMRDYFNHPWSLISVIVAAVLLTLTFLQTLYSIKN